MLPTPRKLAPVLIGLLLLSVSTSPQVKIANANGTNKITFVSDRDGNAEIYVMNPDGSDQTRLTYNSVSDECPVWSRDGGRIAFLRPSGSGKYSVFIMNADGSNEFEAASGLSIGSCISWSPDGQKIAFSYQFNIYTVNIDGSGLGYLTAGMDPAWSPDGTRIAFSKAPPPPIYGSEIYTIDSKTGVLTRLTQVLAYPGLSRPSWSPDGTKIAYSLDLDMGSEMGPGTVSSNNSSPDLVTVPLFFADWEWLSPKWSPRGNQLVAWVPSGIVGLGTQIWRSNTDGSGIPTQLTTGSYNNYQPDWQQSPPPATAFDFDGDWRADISVFRPSTGIWYVDGSQAGTFAQNFGLSTDKLVPADYDGDGKTDIAVFRDGVWYWLNSSNNQFNARQFGQPGDRPIAADFTGDGRAEIAVYRGGYWWSLDDSNGEINTLQFGLPTDIPVSADYDGDGKTDVAVYRPSNGTWYILGTQAGLYGFPFGIPSDVPVPADYDGDGRADAAVFRTGTWYILGSQTGFRGYVWGLSGDQPVPADYDGDGMVDIAIYRDGVWWISESSTGEVAVRQFGTSGDVPVPSKSQY